MSRMLARWVAKLQSKLGDQEGYYVKGSGRVYVPSARLNEIPTVVSQYHELEVERERYKAWFRRV